MSKLFGPWSHLVKSLNREIAQLKEEEVTKELEE